MPVHHHNNDFSWAVTAAAAPVTFERPPPSRELERMLHNPGQPRATQAADYEHPS